MYLVRKAGVLRQAAGGAGETGGNRQFERGNAVEPGDEKPGQMRRTEKGQRDSSEKGFSIYSSSLPREFS